MQRKIYVASSWRNQYLQQAAVHTLRAAGHEVYDFRNPKPGDKGFAWSDIDPDWMQWSVEQYADALTHPIAEAGFKSDKHALDWADCGLLVLPCGRSAHLELGYLAGQGKPCAVLATDPTEPELMVKLCSDGVLASFDELLTWAGIVSDTQPVTA